MISIESFASPILIEGPLGQKGEWLVFKVTPPIYHPSVNVFNGIALARDKDELISEIENPTLAFQCPMNIDAAIDYRRDRARFDAMNMKRDEIVKEPELECAVCLECVNVSCVRFTCFNNHWLCSNCFKTVRECHFCRWKPCMPYPKAI